MLLQKPEKAKLHCVVVWVSKRIQPLKVKEDQDKEESELGRLQWMLSQNGWLVDNWLMCSLTSVSSATYLKNQRGSRDQSAMDYCENPEKNACAMEGRHTCNGTEAGVSPEGWIAARETQEPAQDNMDKGGCRWYCQWKFFFPSFQPFSVWC